MTGVSPQPPVYQAAVGGPLIPVTGAKATQVAVAKPVVTTSTVLIPVTGGVVMTPAVWQQVLFNLGFVFLGIAVVSQGLANKLKKEEDQD